MAIIDKSGILSYLILGIMSILLLFVITINYLQQNADLRHYLPNVLKNWNFLPEFLRSLDPYSRYVLQRYEEQSK